MATLIILVDGTIPTAADFNANFTNLNDELRPATAGGTGLSAVALGDFIYASAANVFSRRAIGTEGQVLTVVSGLPAWGAGAPQLNAIGGLTLSNNGTDAVNDLDIAVGAAVSDDAVFTNRLLMSLTTLITKRLDATWAVGTNQGGLDTGAMANATYHLFLIERPDTGVVDVLFSLSATAPTMPASYTKRRRIGSIIRAGATILAFDQAGDEFLLETPLLEVSNATPSTTAATHTLAGIPAGIAVKGLFNLELAPINTTQNGILLSPLFTPDTAPSLSTAPFATIIMGSSTAIGNFMGCGQAQVWTDAARGIRSRAIVDSGGWSLVTLGWVDRRGRDS